MIRVGLVEDDPASAKVLGEYLKRFQQETGEDFQVLRFSDGAALLKNYRPDFDLLLLDIQMPGIDGFTAAQRIRQADHQVMIVFVTNTPQYAVHGYEVDALSYLLKPVPYMAFAREMQRCVERCRMRQEGWVTLATEGGLLRLATGEVLYAESDKHHVLIHTAAATHRLPGTMKGMEELTAGKGFFRCNSGYLVNLRHVVGVRQNTCLLTGGGQLVISRPRRKAFMAALTDYLAGGA
jgi:DNA-binding LytR/AlgR family response regulator